MPKTKIVIILTFILIFFLYFALSIPYYSGDIKNHLTWAKSLMELGPMGFYERQFPGFAFQNYPPLAMFSFAASLFLYKQMVQLIWNLNTSVSLFPSFLVPFSQWENTEIAFLKLPQLISAIGIGLAIFLFLGLLKRELSTSKRLFYSMLFLLNPATLYISSVWGQIDLMPIMFLLFGLYFFFKEKYILASISASFSLLSKQTVLIYWLIFLIVILKLKGVKLASVYLLTAVIIFYLAYLPFHVFSFMWPLQLYKLNFSLVDFSTSVNSINFWGSLSHFKGVEDTQEYLFMTLQYWGYFIFLLISLPITLVLLVGKFTYQKLFVYLFIITISFFFILTRMHERYLIPVVVFSSILLVFGKRFWVNFVFFSFIHFLNLYRGLYQPNVYILNVLAKSDVFLDVLVALYFILIIYNLIIFYKLAKIKLALDPRKLFNYASR